MKSLVNQMLALLQEYLRINTSQPQLDYAGVIDLFEQRAQRDGLVCQRVGLLSGREALVIVQPGTDPTLPALALNHHMDVVPALDAEQWDFPPFAGACVGDVVYGRGAQDMKGVGVAHYGALLHLVRTHGQPRRTICLVLAPDEETGGYTGAQQLVQTEAFASLNIGYVLDEGLPSGNPEALLLKVSERRPLQLKVMSTGAAVHASRLMSVNPVHELLMFLERIVALQREQQRMVGPFVPVRFALRAHSGRTDGETIASVTSETNTRDERYTPPFALSDELCEESNGYERVSPGQLLSANITSLQAGSEHAINAIPAQATATLDIRIPPGMSMTAVSQMIDELLAGCTGVTCSVHACTQETTAPLDQNAELYRVVAAAVQAAGLRAVPHAAEESSDLRFYRAAGIEGLGLTPFTCAENLHGVNESVPVADIALGCQVFYNVLRDFCL